MNVPVKQSSFNGLVSKEMKTTSRIVAEKFGKLHKNVVRDIRNLECSAEFNALNFEPVEYLDAKGEARTEYAITRDGFAFLVMGFTGKEAAVWKEKFIAAFNSMAQHIQESLVPPVSQEKRSREIRLQMREFGKFGKLMGLEGNQLALSVSKGVEKVTGVNPMGVMGITHMDAPQPKALLNASDIGVRLGGMKPVEVNKNLTKYGFQEKHRDYKNRPYYEPTQKGLAAGAVMQDATKKEGGGTAIRQLRWASTIIDALRSEMEAGQ